MIVTTTMLIEQLSTYENPYNKIARMVASGQLTPIRRGLYETDRNAPGHCLAGSIYGPSYLSFEYALSRHGLIPESVRSFTSATCGKRKSKQFSTPFGTFSFHDVPTSAFSLWVDIVHEGPYSYWLASPEKALCDQLYRLPPVANLSELDQLLFSDLRLYRSAFDDLRLEAIAEIAGKYRSRNVDKLYAYARRRLS